MSGKNDPKTESSPEHGGFIKTPDVKHAKKLAEATKKQGLHKIPVIKARIALKALKAKLSQSPKKSAEVTFTAKEFQQIEKALGMSLSRLDKKTLKYRIKMLTIEELEKAENALPGSGARIFTLIEKEGKKEPTPLGYSFKKGDKITVHFRDNEIAEDNYGMRHLFKQQPEIRQVKIKQTSKRGKGREGLATRRSLDGNFYFADGSYAPIFTGTEIEVVKVFSQTQLDNYKKTAVAYDVGKGHRRYMSRQGAEQIAGYYGITPPPTTKDIKANQEYWRTVDGTDYSQSSKKKSTVRAQEYIPRNERERTFLSKWNEIMAIKDKQRLIDMKDEIPILPDDPIVHVPDERRGIRLRIGAALRYALFKRYAELNGRRISITSSYRSAKLQTKLWYRGLARRMRKYRQRYPNKSPREIEKLARAENARFVAPPGRSHHNTGGAVDIHVSGISMHKYRGSRARYYRAVQTGNLRGFSEANREAVRTRIYMDRVLMASHFLGTNYYRETWHWNIDPKVNGRYVYRNV